MKRFLFIFSLIVSGYVLYPLQYLGASTCSDLTPFFSMENGRLEVPCVGFEGKCLKMVLGLNEDARGLYLVKLEESGMDVPSDLDPLSQLVATVDIKKMTIKIPQTRIINSEGDTGQKAYDVKLSIFWSGPTLLFYLESVAPVDPIAECGGVEDGSPLEPDFSQTSPDSNVDGGSATQAPYIVIAYNDLGMHCMNGDHSVLSILPPYNTLVAQVIRRGKEPDIVTKGVIVEYRMLENDTCQGTNFWDYGSALFGMDIPFCQGLTGNGVSGVMELRDKRFIAEGLPVTPFNNDGQFNPYPLAEVTVKDANTGEILATTQTVVPISYEMNCHKCHGGSGGTETMFNILKKHDDEEGTNLAASTPVLCQSCHEDPALDAQGVDGVPNFSLAMHGKHARLSSPPACYDCHPGPETQCQRTAIEGMQRCEDCHGDLGALARGLREGRTPWLQEPKCSDCHSGKEIDTGNTLYRNAKGHKGIYCETCHYEPHAWWPSLLARDNQQAITLQGSAGPLGSESCLVCHTETPDDDDGPHGMGANNHGVQGHEDDDD